MKKTENLSAGEALDAIIHGEKVRDKFGNLWTYTFPKDMSIEGFNYSQPFHRECAKEPELPQYLNNAIMGGLTKDLTIAILRAVDERIAEYAEDHFIAFHRRS